MGTFRVPLDIGTLQGSQWERVEALVDTGATYTVVPSSFVHRLGIHPYERWPFRLADGCPGEMDVGFALVRVNGRSSPTVIVFGAEETQPLLGAHALEGLWLAPDPLARRLVPVPGLLMAGARGSP